MNENSENIEWKHIYTIKEMTPIQDWKGFNY